MAERTIIAAAISILTFLVLAAIFAVDGPDDVFEAIYLPLMCLGGASVVLAKVEPRGEILFYVTMALPFFISAVRHFLDAKIWRLMLSVFIGLHFLWLGLQNRTQNDESARTFFYRVTWFVFVMSLFGAIFWVNILIVGAINVGYGSAVIEKDDILEGLETICFVVLAVSNWFVAMEDQIPISLEDNSDEHKKDEELQAYVSMT
mmetsp:Transcript_11285/g.11382  ORF Transcript_11285/g.11382 Transcript_11285/m.11382 type:complete len:204 (-) Transcript_11285:124-735(-)|eukprot:CAMPEP_0171316268 /NCGR_PEP_ID=MMETSP0816-20121228/71562_1 /TAXON_ID=420281 /ORGANISM="Proboscia inermis, Strain CCAP1064/1" /LENGTH=203 /DNA_ID=CAMNT_0011808035 /DNA_START=197 /DNA_END=808 /DNA_ORIENTATION=-